MRKGGYVAQVYEVGSRDMVDYFTCKFGEFKEIGLWLDNNYYNDPRYYVKITFHEEKGN
jgi:hypothetical protein